MTEPSPESTPELTMEDYDALYCWEHGFLSHVIFHEAAHAVFAARFDIEFFEATVLPPAEWATHGTGLLAGGVRPVQNGTLWVPEMPDLAMDFAMVGSVAEERVYGHHLDASYVGDVWFWAAGMGLEVTEENVKEVAKKISPLMRESKKRLKSGTLQTILADVEKVARAFIAKVETDGKLYTVIEGPLVLTCEEIADIIRPPEQADTLTNSVAPSI